VSLLALVVFGIFYKRIQNDHTNVELVRVQKKEMRERRLRAKREGADETDTLT
jgi:hypothetical protein